MEKASQSRDANSYGLLIAVLLERGEPVTLEETARRLAEVGLGDESQWLTSLKRCRPGRPPIYRIRDRYALDPHHDEADLWAFRLGLKPPRVMTASSTVTTIPPPSLPMPEPDKPLTLEELAEAWRRYVPSSWSSQRLAVAVLDAHRRPMKPEEVVAYVNARGAKRLLRVEGAQYWRTNPAIEMREDGFWDLRAGHETVRTVRRLTRDLIVAERRNRGPTREEIEAREKIWDQERTDQAKKQERLRRVLIHVFPADRPEAIVVIDVNAHRLDTLIGSRMQEIQAYLEPYDVIIGLEIREVLQVLGVDPGLRQLAELGATQKGRQLNRSGRTLKITTDLLIHSSCGISQPLGDPVKMRAYFQEGQETRFRRRLEADAKALLAYYQYGRLHFHVRLRWGFLDERLPAPWVHRDEIGLHGVMKRAFENNLPMEIVAGSAPGWENPWSRACRVRVCAKAKGWGHVLVGEDDLPIDPEDVQAARVVESRDADK